MCEILKFTHFSPIMHAHYVISNYHYLLYILRGFRKLVITFFPVKNTHKLINQQLKNEVKIVTWKKKVITFLLSKIPLPKT